MWYAIVDIEPVPKSLRQFQIWAIQQEYAISPTRDGISIAAWLDAPDADTEAVSRALAALISQAVGSSSTVTVRSIKKRD